MLKSQFWTSSASVRRRFSRKSIYMYFCADNTQLPKSTGQSSSMSASHKGLNDLYISTCIQTRVLLVFNTVLGLDTSKMVQLFWIVLFLSFCKEMCSLTISLCACVFLHNTNRIISYVSLHWSYTNPADACVVQTTSFELIKLSNPKKLINWW